MSTNFKLNYDLDNAGIYFLVLGPIILLYLSTYGLIIYTVLAFIYFLFVQAKQSSIISNRYNHKQQQHHILSDATVLKDVIDSNVLKHVMDNFPGFCTDPAMERCDWANHGMRAVFPYAAAFEGRKMHAKLVYKLQNLKGPVKIELIRFEAGEIPPICTGVKVNDYKNDGKVVMEGDVVFNGLPSIEVKVSAFGFSLTIEIHEITLCAQLRMIIGPLYVASTPAKAVGVSFKRPPYIHFAMKVGGIDIMHLGPGPLQICRIVDGLMKKAINDEFLYPNISWSEFDKTYDLKELPVMDKPLGVLIVHVKSASDLIVCDFTSSDPYVKLQLGIEERITKVIYRNLNPCWNEKHYMEVFDIDTQVLEISLFDHDVLTSHDFMGCAHFNIKQLEFYVKHELDLILEDVENGSVKLELLYIPLDTDQSVARDWDNDANAYATESMKSVRSIDEGDNQQQAKSLAVTFAKAFHYDNDDDVVINYSKTNKRRLTLLFNSNKEEGLQPPPPPPSSSSFRSLFNKQVNKGGIQIVIPSVEEEAYGTILFYFISCVNLQHRDKSCCTYVQFKFDDIYKTTDIKHGTNSPVFWKNIVYVISSNKKYAFIEMKVKDNNANNIGYCHVNVKEIITKGEIHYSFKIDALRDDTLLKFSALWCKPSLKPRIRRPPPVPSLPIPPDAKYI